MTSLNRYCSHADTFAEDAGKGVAGGWIGGVPLWIQRWIQRWIQSECDDTDGVEGGTGTTETRKQGRM